MQVNTVYSEFNSLLEKAEIPINIDKLFQIAVVESPINPAIKLLELKATNTLLQEDVSLQMSMEEARQFNLLFAQFLKQL